MKCIVLILNNKKGQDNSKQKQAHREINDLGYQLKSGEILFHRRRF